MKTKDRIKNPCDNCSKLYCTTYPPTGQHKEKCDLYNTWLGLEDDGEVTLYESSLGYEPFKKVFSPGVNSFSGINDDYHR